MVMWELLEHKKPFEKDSEVDAATKIKGQEVIASDQWDCDTSSSHGLC